MKKSILAKIVPGLPTTPMQRLSEFKKGHPTDYTMGEMTIQSYISRTLDKEHRNLLKYQRDFEELLLYSWID